MGEASWFDGFRRRREESAYAAALARWELECERLDKALASAAPDRASRAGRVGTRLQPGEYLQCELSDVDLVETRQFPAETVSRQANVGLNTPISVGFSTTRTTPAPPSDESVVLDTGTVAVTDRRVTFAGRKHAREWPLDQLIRPVPDEEGCTIYLPLSSRDLTSGFRYDPRLAWSATSQLEIALARHSGDWRVVEGWRARREQLRRQRPQPPAHLRVAPDRVRHARNALLDEELARTEGPAPDEQRLLGRRLAARVLDAALGMLLIGLLALVFGGLEAGTLLAYVVGISLYEVLPVYRRGASVGKRVVGLEVIDVDTNGRPPLWQSFLRAALLTGEVLTIVVPIMLGLRLAMGLDRRAWHDSVAGTAVVETRR